MSGYGRDRGRDDRDRGRRDYDDRRGGGDRDRSRSQYDDRRRDGGGYGMLTFLFVLLLIIHSRWWPRRWQRSRWR